MSALVHRGDCEWEIPREGDMLVPGLVFASEEMLNAGDSAEALQQVRNVAHLPGIVRASMAMPDIHWGYGFPIGGVAATDIDRGGVVSPGGVGFDICCGVRLLRSGFTAPEFATHAEAVMGQLDRRIPRGTGTGAIAPGEVLEAVLSSGARAALDAGFGTEGDLERCEDGGVWRAADPHAVSTKARTRGAGQLGSLGAGNHFLEVQVVDRVVDAAATAAFGLAEGMVCVMIHCGSRGLGHQVCTDELGRMGAAMARHRIRVPDRQLACVPVSSADGERYLGAMGAAANFAWANRHVLAHETREAFAAGFRVPPDQVGLDLVFDVAHNLARVEVQPVDGKDRRLCVHRKGATRSLPPGHPQLVEAYRSVGQPVLIPGSMGTASWVSRGVAGNPAFGSAAHGAGRVMSRHEALRRRGGGQVKAELERQGIAVRPGSVRLLAEEAPYAYKDIDQVVEVCDRAGLAAPVARLRPLGVVKG